jgi:hypothetical protein
MNSFGVLIEKAWRNFSVIIENINEFDIISFARFFDLGVPYESFILSFSMFPYNLVLLILLKFGFEGVIFIQHADYVLFFDGNCKYSKHIC